jgi:DNA-binding response OmpR family regulator
VSKGTVLIIANPFEAMLVRKALEDVGVAASVAEGGEGALAKFDEETPAAVVLAHDIYSGDAAAMIAAMRARPVPRVPVVLVSDEPWPQCNLDAEELARRPIDPQVLLERIEELLGEPLPRSLTAEPDEGLMRADDAMVDPLLATSSAAPAPPASRDELLEPEILIERTPAPQPATEAAPATEEDAPAPVLDVVAEAATEAAAAALPDLTAELEFAIEDREILEEENLVGRDQIVEVEHFVGRELIVDEQSVGVREPAGAEQPAAASPVQRIAEAEQAIFSAAAARDDEPPRRDTLRDLRIDRLGLDVLQGLEAELGLAAPTANGSAGHAAAAGSALAQVIPAREQPPADAPPVASEPAPEPRGAAELGALPDFESGQGLTEGGDLAVESLPELLARLHRAGFSGRLLLRHGEGERAIYFDAGFPVWATSNLSHDGLVELLYREGKLNREQAGRLHRAVHGRALAESLVEASAIKPGELFTVMRHHAEEIIYSAFVWERGSFHLGPEVAARDDTLGIGHPYALALEGIRRKYGPERLVEKVGPPSTELAPTASLAAILPDAGLSTAERAAAQLVRHGSATVAALQAEGRLDAAGAYALAWGLLAIGALTRGPSATVATTADGAPAVDRERAIAKLGQVSDGDYFTILGVGRDATPYEIRRAWERMRFDFAPERFDPSVRDELGGQLEEIVEVVDEAFHALSDDRLRDAYRAHLQ